MLTIMFCGYLAHKFSDEKVAHITYWWPEEAKYRVTYIRVGSFGRLADCTAPLHSFTIEVIVRVCCIVGHVSRSQVQRLLRS